MNEKPEKPERPSIDEMYESLNWYDEQAIAKAVDADIHDLMELYANGESGIKTMTIIARAFEYVHARRQGMKDAEAIAHVRNLNMQQITDVLQAYIEHEDEIDPEQPVTEAGKDGSAVE